MNEDFDDMYCRICGSCGCDGCCPDFKCQHVEGCLYPQTDNGLFIKFCRFISKHISYKVASYIYFRFF